MSFSSRVITSALVTARRPGDAGFPLGVSRLRVKGSGLKVRGAGCGVQGAGQGFRFEDSGLRVLGSRFED